MSIKTRYTNIHDGEFDRTVFVNDWMMLDVRKDGRVIGIEELGDHDSAAVALALAWFMRVEPVDR